MANRIKSDSTTRQIVAALRKEGATVHYIRPRRGNGKQNGMPDLMVGYCGKMFLLECKAPNGELSEDQIIWHSEWTGPKVVVVSSELEALISIGLTP